MDFQRKIFRGSDMRMDSTLLNGYRNGTITNIPKLAFLKYSEEECPDTGTRHYQWHCVAVRKMKGSGLKKLFGSNTIHIEDRCDYPEHSATYCGKEYTHIAGPWIYGDEALNVKEISYTEACKKVFDGEDPITIVEEHPYLALHIEQFKKIHNAYLQRKREKPIPKVYIYNDDIKKIKRLFPDIREVEYDNKFLSNYRPLRDKEVLFNNIIGTKEETSMLFKFCDANKENVRVLFGTIPWIPEVIVINALRPMPTWKWRYLPYHDKFLKMNTVGPASVRPAPARGGGAGLPSAGADGMT